MCWVLRHKMSKMALPNDNNYSHADRMDNTKQVMKPYRDNHVNCLRLVTGSARVNLNKHWKSLEDLFTADRDHCKERMQNMINESLENGEGVCSGSSSTMTTESISDVAGRLRRLHVDRRTHDSFKSL